jgi:hypothetical protein
LASLSQQHLYVLSHIDLQIMSIRFFDYYRISFRVIIESSLYSSAVSSLIEAQPENKANPKNTNTVKKTYFHITPPISSNSRRISNIFRWFHFA